MSLDRTKSFPRGIENTEEDETQQEESDDSTCKGGNSSVNSMESKIARMNETRVLMRGYLLQ